MWAILHKHSTHKHKHKRKTEGIGLSLFAHILTKCLNYYFLNTVSEKNLDNNCG